MTNSAYILTDYSKENGSIAMVPGSHRLGRLPYPGEGLKDMVPVEAPAARSSSGRVQRGMAAPTPS